MTTAPILILAALPEEADAVMPGEGGGGTVGPYTTRTLAIAGRAVIVAASGIGKVAIATAAAFLVARCHPRLLFVTGTGGALVPQMREAHWITAAVQHDYGAARAGAFVTYPPTAWPMGRPGDPLLPALPQPAGLALAETVMASGDAFVEDMVLAERLRRAFGAGLVDMETAAVAQVAQLHGLPWAAIKAATDDANHESAAIFHDHLQAASRRAGAAVERAVALL